MWRLPALLLLLACQLPLSARAGDGQPLPFLSPIFGEHMVLQRNQPDRLWGWTQPGATVRVTLAGHQASTVAAPDGRWQVQVDPPAAGGPYALAIDGPQHVEFHDVLVGDLWVCGGQSNMEFGLAGVRDGTDEVNQVTHAAIRLFRVAAQPAYAPASVPRGEWRPCEPASFTRAGGFSAVAYYFGRKVQEATGIPIGLVQDASGGSPAESWMSREALEPMAFFSPALAEIDRLRARGAAPYGNFIMHWYDDYDRGIQHGSWADPALDDSAWKPVMLKQGFAALGVPDQPAVVWFRREITLPDKLPAGPARIFLGVVEKMDTTYLNGHWVGASSWVENPRVYPVADGVLHPGRNLVTIRVLKLKPDGGFQSPAADLRLVLGDGSSIPLEGEWKGAVGVDARPPHPLPLGYENYPTMPAVLHLGMLRPLASLAITGVIWYQGEANFTRAAQYRTLLPALIADWRRLFARADLPFYIAGLPAFMARRDQPPATDGWTELREAQALTARAVPHTALAVTVDTGEADNIHPREKRPVGERLALCALKETYGLPVVSEGPVFAKMELEPGRVRLHFTHTDGGLVMKGARLGEFAVAGADHVWHWAEARIDGDTVVVKTPLQPVAVRYAWQANPLASLYNGAGLPAVPFRTDDWSANPP